VAHRARTWQAGARGYNHTILAVALTLAVILSILAAAL
jgi:hypothetical protein